MLHDWSPQEIIALVTALGALLSTIGGLYIKLRAALKALDGAADAITVIKKVGGSAREAKEKLEEWEQKLTKRQRKALRKAMRKAEKLVEEGKENG